MMSVCKRLTSAIYARVWFQYQVSLFDASRIKSLDTKYCTISSDVKISESWL